jgi:dTDP-4-dehydrorhamnose 3,5-epimerase
MRVSETELAGVFVLEPDVHDDERGFFMESYSKRRLDEALGRDVSFVQDNHSRSRRGVLRGLHYQAVPHPQAKLVRAVIGEIFDVAVDVRRSSPNFGRWVGVNLSAENRRQLWIPEGFAHGFLTLSDSTEVLYKSSDYYAPECERSIRWDDPSISIGWPLTLKPTLSAKDSSAPPMSQAELFP